MSCQYWSWMMCFSSSITWYLTTREIFKILKFVISTTGAPISKFKQPMCSPNQELSELSKITWFGHLEEKLWPDVWTQKYFSLGCWWQCWMWLDIFNFSAPNNVRTCRMLICYINNNSWKVQTVFLAGTWDIEFWLVLVGDNDSGSMSLTVKIRYLLIEGSKLQTPSYKPLGK